METSGPGLLSRVGERMLGWIGLALIVAAGFGLWQMGPQGRGAIWDAIWRTGFWLVLVAVLPWTAQLFIRRVRDAGTNWAGVGLIAGLTLIDLLAGVLLLTGWPASGWGWFAAFAAIGLAGTYNFLVAEYLADTAG